jgi:methylglyoxal reductase
MKEYMAAGVLDAIQPRYSILDRKIEKEILPFCASNSISTLVYSPLEQGLLTGRFGMDHQVPDGQFRNNLPWFAPVNREKVLSMVDSWKDLTQSYGCTLSQLVIAWTIAQKGVTTALVGSRKKVHVKDNVAAGDLELKQADLDRMRNDAVAMGDPEDI